ncbi:hypothetical protein J4407_03055 [Candidatus Pacearchaeota archaeon]|nr:hypothetical protein [Candidatus Pacearchaeota archaeon]
MEKRQFQISPESRKLRAYDIGDASGFYEICVELGINRNNLSNAEKKLYDKGRQPTFDLIRGGLEKKIEPEKTGPISKPRKRRVSNTTYEGFLTSAQKIYDHLVEHGKPGDGDVRKMREALLDNFGYKFGPYGITPLRDMSDGQVTGTFRGTVEYAKRRLDK